jgi:hypothetical protein
VRVVGVRDVLQRHQEEQRDRLGQVQRLGRAGQDLLGVVQVGAEIGRLPLGVLVSSARAWARTIGSLST